MRYVYIGVLAACLIGTLPLEFLLHTRVYARWRRLALTVLPVALAFVGWDLAAIAAGHWHYDRRQLLDVFLPGRLPVEELLFFLVVPICAVLTLEAVRSARGWSVGDEPPSRPRPAGARRGTAAERDRARPPR